MLRPNSAHNPGGAEFHEITWAPFPGRLRTAIPRKLFRAPTVGASKFRDTISDRARPSGIGQISRKESIAQRSVFLRSRLGIYSKCDQRQWQGAQVATNTDPVPHSRPMGNSPLNPKGGSIAIRFFILEIAI